jgi:hypothetical protein
MSNKGSNEYRNSLIMRFILIYILCILFAVIPLYFLFNIPQVAKKEMKASELSNKEQRKLFQQFDEIIVALDSSLNQNKFDNEYKKNCLKLLQYADEKLDKSSMVQPYLSKIAKLYERIELNYEYGRKDEINTLKEENKKLAEEMKQAIIDLQLAIAKIPGP